MKFQRKKVATALAYVLGVGSVALLTAAPAQAADIKVDVTGSNIRRLEGEGALPVQVITREEIERTGATSALDLLQYVSANNTGGQIAATTQSARRRSACRRPRCAASAARTRWCC
jgi:iron complex outermembrane receptor protein